LFTDHPKKKEIKEEKKTLTWGLKRETMSFLLGTVMLKINKIKQPWFQNIKNYTAIGGGFSIRNLQTDIRSRWT
jgi:hypothetical protein